MDGIASVRRMSWIRRRARDAQPAGGRHASGMMCPQAVVEGSGSATFLRTDAPEGAILVLLRCWVLLYGAVSMEVFGHLGFALDDPAPMFDLTLADLARLVGLEYPLPEA
jgi:hypothetical protein